MSTRAVTIGASIRRPPYCFNGGTRPVGHPMPYFNAAHLPPSNNEYVAWIDVMGTQASMSRSVRATANFVFKIHAAALQAPRSAVRLYPVMDGLYAAAPSQNGILEFLTGVFSSLATEFIGEKHPLHRFLLRGGLAYGPVIHGAGIGAEASDTLAENAQYRDAILLGMPMVQAHQVESSAPPFGIAVHESARSFAPEGIEPLHVAWLRWSNNPKVATWSKAENAILAHLDWFEQRSGPLSYPKDRIAAHRQMVREYFAK